MDLDATQALDLDEYDETEEEEQEVKKDRKQVGQLKVFRTEDFEEKIYDIFQGENFIGRDERTDVYIPRKALSKTHACIEVSEDLHLVYDDNSKNRTRRDKMILKPQVRYELHHGDMLTLADIKCQYFKGKMDQDKDDDDTGSETGSESMLPEGLAIHNKDTSKKEDTFAADTDSETDDEKSPVNIKKPVVYSSDEKLAKQDVVEDSDQPKPIVPAFMYDSSDDDDDEHVHGTKSSSNFKAHMDVSADSGTLAFALVSPDDVPIIRPTSKKMLEVENTPLTLVYSPDTQERTPDNPSILSKGKGESSYCASTLIYGSESPSQEKSPIKEKQGSSQPQVSTKIRPAFSDSEPDTPDKMHVKNISEPQREIASCAETLPVQEIESLKETPVRDVELPVFHGTDKLEETPINDMPKIGETPSESNVFLPETQGFSPGNEETSFCEPTQAYLQESPVDTPKETPGEMVSDVTSIPDSQEEEGEDEGENPEVKKVLSYDDDSATQAYTWNDSDATDDEDDELRFQATQAYPSHIQQPEEKDKERKDKNVATKDDDDIQQGAANVQDRSPCASSSPHEDIQQTIAYDVTEMDTQAYVTEKDAKGKEKHPKGQSVEIEPTLPYNIMDMETQAYEAETEESTSPASDRPNVSHTDEEDKGSPEEHRDSKGVTIEPTLPYDLETETQDLDNNDKDVQNTSGETSKKNGENDNPEIEATVPYDIDIETQAYGRKDMEDSETDDEGNLEKKEAKVTDMMETQAYGRKDMEDSETDDVGNLQKKEAKMTDMMETQAYGRKDIEDSETDDDGNLEKKEANMADMMETQAYDKKDMEDSETDDEGNLQKKEENMADMMETQAYGADVEAEENDVNTAGPSNVNDDYGDTQAYGLEDQMTSPSVTDDVIPDSDDVLSQEIPLNRITQEDDTVNNNVRDKTSILLNDRQQIEESGNKEEEEEAEIIVRPKRRGRGRVTQSSPEENQQPAMPNKPDDTTMKITQELSTETPRKAGKSLHEPGTALEDVEVKRSTRGKKSKKSNKVETEIQDPLVDDSEEDQFKIATKPEGTRERRSTKEKTVMKSKEDNIEEEQSASLSEKRPTRGRRPKKSEAESARVENILPDDTVEKQQESASLSEKRPTRGRRSRKGEVETKIQSVVPDDTEEQPQESASVSEKRPTRGRHRKTEVEPAIVQSVLPDDTEEQPQESASVSEKRPTRGRHRKTEVEPAIVQSVLPDDTEEQPQESASVSEKRPLRGRHRKTEVEPAIVHGVLPDDTEKDRLSFKPVPTEKEDLPAKKSLRGRRSAKTGKEVEKEENKPVSTPEKRVQEKMSTRGTRSKKKDEEEDIIDETQPGDNKRHLGTSAANLETSVPEHKSPSRKREKKREVMSKVEDIPPGDSEEEQFAVKHKGKGKTAVSLKCDQDSSGIDEELPSMEVIFSGKKAAKGKGKTKGKAKYEETPAMLSSKDSFTTETVRDEEMSSETVEVKPFFPRRGRGRVTQSDDSASAIPEFNQEDLMSPQSVAKSISTRKGMKRNEEDQTQKETKMNTRESQSNTPSPSGGKTRKRAKEVMTDLNESQSSVTSSVGRNARGKGRGNKAKATEADDTHIASASQASDLSESQSSTPSTVESRGRGKGRRRTGKASTTDDTQGQEVPETPAKKGRTVKQEDSPTMLHSPSLRERKHVTPKIMFTGVSDKQAGKIVTSLGGILVDSVYECTHLITDKVRRTVKFLCGLASGQMIVQPQWLTACKKAKHFIEPVPFIVSDKAAEKQYSFSLQQSLERAQKGGLLEGYKIHITKNVKPEPSQMKDIIKSAKGEYLPRMPRTMENNVLVVSSEEDHDLCKPALACGVPVYSSELLLTGILRQELELDQNRLFFVEEDGNRKRKESEDGETPVKSASRKRRKK